MALRVAPQGRDGILLPIRGFDDGPSLLYRQPLANNEGPNPSRQAPDHRAGTITGLEDQRQVRGRHGRKRAQGQPRRRRRQPAPPGIAKGPPHGLLRVPGLAIQVPTGTTVVR